MRNSLLIILCFLLVQVASAQDIIVKTNGDELSAKVLEITTDSVRYLAPDSVDTKRYSLAKTEIFMIRFANGTKEVFQKSLVASEDDAVVGKDPDEMYQLGQEEAKVHYKGNGALLGSVASSFFFPYGLVVPVIIGSVKPKAYENKTLPAHNLQDIHYVRGYEKQAYKVKVGKVALGASIGTAAFITVILAALSSVQ